MLKFESKVNKIIHIHTHTSTAVSLQGMIHSYICVRVVQGDSWMFCKWPHRLHVVVMVFYLQLVSFILSVVMMTNMVKKGKSGFKRLNRKSHRHNQGAPSLSPRPSTLPVKPSASCRNNTLWVFLSLSRYAWSFTHYLIGCCQEPGSLQQQLQRPRSQSVGVGWQVHLWLCVSKCHKQCLHAVLLQCITANYQCKPHGWLFHCSCNLWLKCFCFFSTQPFPFAKDRKIRNNKNQTPTCLLLIG